MKKVVSLLLTAILCFSLCAPAMASGEVAIKLFSDSKRIEADTKIVNNRTLIPLRALMESTGASVEWNGDLREVSISRDGKTIIITIDSPIMKTPDGNKTLDCSPIIINNSTYAPIRAIAEEFGLTVDWDGGTRTILVTTPDGCPYVDFYLGATLSDLINTGELTIKTFEELSGFKYEDCKDTLFTIVYNAISLETFAKNQGLSADEFKAILALPEDYPADTPWGKALGDISFGSYVYNIAGASMLNISIEQAVAQIKDVCGLGDEYTSSTPFKYIRPIMDTIELNAAMEAEKQETELKNQLIADRQKLPELTKNKIYFTITLNDGSKMQGELYPDLAPITVANFVELAKAKFYDGLIFHRVIDGFVLQGGGYDKDFNEKPAPKQITGEFYANGIANPLAHEKGVISMARTNDPNSATSEFFIMDEANPSLDGNYAAFGKVTSGLGVIEKISKVKTQTLANGMSDVPVNPVIIKSITIR